MDLSSTFASVDGKLTSPQKSLLRRGGPGGLMKICVFPPISVPAAFVSHDEKMLEKQPFQSKAQQKWRDRKSLLVVQFSTPHPNPPFARVG
jgi:hypothetical protein